MRIVAINLLLFIGLGAIALLLYPVFAVGFNGFPAIPSGEAIPIVWVRLLYLLYVFSQILYGVLDKNIHIWSDYRYRKYAVMLMLLTAIGLPLVDITLKMGMLTSGAIIFVAVTSMLCWLPVGICCIRGNQPTFLSGRFIPLLFSIITSIYNIFIIAHFD
jgi:hypothetical protein